ncbi:uncharacterized protein LOC143563858 [Bidens hawaiensis]|uniref:uncharacterized protein LOC143563858 n=1 Tax=Bidens hawaiensis TaxID=980011 RepID=UPI00404941A9
MQVMKLIRLCEILSLRGINDLDNILPDLYQEGFYELKHIELRECDNIRRLVKTCDLDALQISVTSNELGQRKTKGKLFSRVEEINLEFLSRLELLWDSPHTYISFCNLKSIDIQFCSSLLELFPVSVAQGLVNLRELTISECKSLMVVISAENEQRCESEIELVNQVPDIVFPLALISLDNLPKLESFFSGRSFIKYPSLKLIEAYGCPSMKRWSYGDNHYNQHQI